LFICGRHFPFPCSKQETRARRAEDIAPIVVDLKASGAASLRQLAAGLNDRGIPTARGGIWSAVQVMRVIQQAVE
jgi:hypothetical protein